jgi:hypothetical protein
LITRQDAETELPELVGRTVQALRVLQYWRDHRLVDPAVTAYLQLDDGSWQRFFLDAHVLFWRTVDEIDVELSVADAVDESGGGGVWRIVDLGADRRLVGRTIEAVSMRQVTNRGTLSLVLDPPALVLLEHFDDERTEISVIEG